MSTLEALKKEALACTQCELRAGCKQVVFDRGDPGTRIMLVGEAPGADEDEAGKPFVGMSGKYLHGMFQKIGLDTRTDLYVTNIVKCRPPGNRTPTDEEMKTCGVWLDRQIQIVKPKLIVAIGNTALKYFYGRTGITRLRGKWFDYQGTPVTAIYHPSYLMRMRWKKDEPDSPHRQTLEDLLAIKAAISQNNA